MPLLVQRQTMIRHQEHPATNEMWVADVITLPVQLRLKFD